MNFQERRYEVLTDKFNKMGQKIVSHQSGFLGLEVGEGRLPRQGVEEGFPQGDEQSIAEAINYVQKIGYSRAAKVTLSNGTVRSVRY